MTEQERKLFAGMPEEDAVDLNRKEVLIDQRIDQYLAAVLHVLRTELDLSEDVSPLTAEQIQKFRKSMSDHYSVAKDFYSDAQKEFLEKLRQKDPVEFKKRTGDTADYENHTISEAFQEITPVLGGKAINNFRDIEKTDQYLEELKNKENDIRHRVNFFISDKQKQHDSARERDHEIICKYTLLPQKRIDKMEKIAWQQGYLYEFSRTETERAYSKAMSKETANISVLSSNTAEVWKKDMWNIREMIASTQYHSFDDELHGKGVFELSDENKEECSSAFYKDTGILEGIRKTFEKEEDQATFEIVHRELHLQSLEGRAASLEKQRDTLSKKIDEDFSRDYDESNIVLEHAQNNDVSYFDAELEKAKKILEDIKPLEALKSEMDLIYYGFNTGWDTNRKEDILVWNPTNENEKPIPLIDMLEDAVKRNPNMDAASRKNLVNGIFQDKLVLFHSHYIRPQENAPNHVRLTLLDGRVAEATENYEFLPPNLSKEPIMPNPPKPLNFFEKFMDGFMKLFKSRTNKGLAYDNAVNQYPGELNEYNATMQIVREHRENSPLANHYKSPAPSMRSREQEIYSLRTDTVAKIDLLKEVKEDILKLKPIDLEIKSLKKEIATVTERSKKIVADHDKTWNQLIEVVAENACKRGDAMLNGTYQRADFEFESLIPNKQPEKSAEPLKASEIIEPVIVAEKKSSGPQLG